MTLFNKLGYPNAVRALPFECYFTVGTGNPGPGESNFVKPMKLEEHKYKSYQNAFFFFVTFTWRLSIRVLVYSCFNQLLHHSYHVVPRALAC